MSVKVTTRSGRSVKPAKRLVEDPASASLSEFSQEPRNSRSNAQVKEIQSKVDTKRVLRRTMMKSKGADISASPNSTVVQKTNVPESSVNAVNAQDKEHVLGKKIAKTMSVKVTTRSGRSVKPAKRLVEDPASSSFSEFSQEPRNSKSNAQVKEIQSKESTKSVPRRTMIKSKVGDIPSPSNSNAVKKTNVPESSVNAQDKKHVPIYMRKEKNSTEAELSFVNMAPDPYEELDYLALDDEKFIEKNKKKVQGKGANTKKRKPKKTKAEQILMFGSTKKDKEARQAIKQLKNLQTPSQESKKKCVIPKIVIEATKDDGEVFENIQFEDIPSPPHENHSELPIGTNSTVTLPTPTPSNKIRNETWKTPKVRPNFVPERKASTPKATIPHKPTKEELMKNCFGFDDSSTEDEDKPKNESLNYSPMQNVRKSFIQMTPAAAPQPPRGRHVSGSSISAPWRFDFKQPGQKPIIKSRSKYVNKPIKPLKEVPKPTSSINNEQNEVSLFDDPLDKNCNDEMEDLNAFEVLGKASKKTKVAAKKPLKTITNTGNASKSTTQSLIYEKTHNGQKQLRSKRKAITTSDDSENETESRNISRTYERADALNCSISAYESPKKARKTQKVSVFFRLQPNIFLKLLYHSRIATLINGQQTELTISAKLKILISRSIR